MAIEHTLFPEIEGLDFVRSSEVAAVGERILDRHGRAGGIASVRRVRSALVDDVIRLEYLLNTKPFDPTKDDVKHDAIAKVVKAPRLWHDVTGIDVVVWVRAYFWNMFDERQRSGVLLHELLHVDVAIDEKTGEAKVSLLEHDVEEFILAVRHYGAFIPNRESLVKAFGLWQQDDGKPARPRTVEEIAEDVDRLPMSDAALVHAAAELRRGLQASGMDVTGVTTNERGVRTIHVEQTGKAK